MDNPIQFTKSEQEVIDTANALAACTNTPGWKHIVRWMDDYIELAHSRMEGSLSHNPQVSLVLQLRWKERKEMRDALLAVIAETLEAKKEVLVLVAKSHGARQDEAEQFAEQGIF